MIITCKKCGVSFKLDETLLKSSGSKVRCSKCKLVFLAFPPVSEPEPETRPAPEPPPEPGPEPDSEPGQKAQESDDEGGEADTEGVGDLELSLDESEDETPAAPGTDDLELSLEDDEEDELDFSEVDSLLESDDNDSSSDTVEESADDLDFSESDSVDKGIEQQEIDLSEIEQTIEMELLEPDDSEDKDEEEPEDPELALSDDDSDKELDEDLELSGDDDFSGIEKMLASDDDEENVEDMADDFDKEKASEADEDEAAVAGEDKKDKKKPDKKAKKAEKAEKKKVGRVFLWLFFIIVLVAAIAVGGYILADRMGVNVPPLDKIPYIGELTRGSKRDVAPTADSDVNVVKNSIQSDFVKNDKAGKLFVISGTVTNKSSAPKSYIEVSANLYSQGDIRARTTISAYCGNVLTRKELSQNDISSIRARIANRAGIDRQNVGIQPGATVPFMIVFPDLPADLAKYDVAVSDSSPAQ